MDETSSRTTIDLLRHGECEGGHIFRGTTDVVLSAQGWENMQRVVDHQRKRKDWDQVISSPLLRCKLFAESIAKEHELPLSVEKDLREMDFGDWEGQAVHKVLEEEGDKVEALYLSPYSFQAPNGEAMYDFSQRIITTAERIFDEHRGRHLLFIQHGGTMRVLFTHLLSMPMASAAHFYIPYACFSRIQISHRKDSDKTHLIFHNLLA